MFSRPFAEFEPNREDRPAVIAVHDAIVERVRRCIDAGLLQGDPEDVAHIVLAMARGLAATENAGWLGSSEESAARRWGLGIDSIFGGLVH